MSSLVNFYREIEKSKRETKELKCVICKKDILDDSHFIKGKYYHNSCIENLIKQNTELKEEIEKQFKSMTAIIHHNSDLYLEESNKLIKERQQIKDNWNKLKEWMNSEMERFEDNPYTRLGMAVFSKVLDKMQEIEGGMNE